MQAWVGPAIVAAVISSLISVVGWFVSHRLALALEEKRRKEKIVDFQIALHAEIRSELHQLWETDFDRSLLEITRRYARDPKYSVTVPHPVRHAVFEALIEEIHILPQRVIDPVIVYNRQRYTVEKLVEDMRARSFATRPRDVQLAMYEDYVALRKYQTTLAKQAIVAIVGSLAREGINIQAADPSVRQ